MDYAVIADNGGSDQRYKDIVGEVYTFPHNYVNILTEGTKFVYERCGVKSMRVAEPDHERLLAEPHYFGIAEIGKVKSVGEDRYEAQIINYKHFRQGIPFRLEDGTHFELAEGYFWRNGVRPTIKEVYDEIAKLGFSSDAIPYTTPLKDIKIDRFIKTTNTRATAKNRSSVKCVNSLLPTATLKSNTFANDTLQFVANKEGYWLYSVIESKYYLLAPIVGNFADSGELKLRLGLKSKEPIIYDDKKFSLCHDIYGKKYEIGRITIAENSIEFYDGNASRKTMNMNEVKKVIPISIAI